MFGAAIGACEVAQHWARAVQLLQEMKLQLVCKCRACRACRVRTYQDCDTQKDEHAAAEHCLRHALEHDVVKVSSVVSACQGQWPVALDS